MGSLLGCIYGMAGYKNCVKEFHEWNSKVRTAWHDLFIFCGCWKVYIRWIYTCVMCACQCNRLQSATVVICIAAYIMQTFVSWNIGINTSNNIILTPRRFTLKGQARRQRHSSHHNVLAGVLVCHHPFHLVLLSFLFNSWFWLFVQWRNQHMTMMMKWLSSMDQLIHAGKRYLSTFLSGFTGLLTWIKFKYFFQTSELPQLWRGTDRMIQSCFAVHQTIFKQTVEASSEAITRNNIQNIQASF